MVMSVMKTRFMLPFIALGAMVLTSCNNFSNDKKLHDYMAEQDASQIMLDSIMNTTKREDKCKETIVRQSTVDSMAYRNLFDKTILAKDSVAISELNKIAAKASLEKVQKSDAALLSDCYRNYVYNTACSEGISIKEADNLKGDLENISTNNGTYGLIARIQAFSDKYFYGKFFKEKGLFNDNEFYNSFNKVSKNLSE